VRSFDLRISLRSEKQMATTVNYTVSPIVEAGLDWAALSAHQTPGTVGPDTFANDGWTYFYVKNTSGSPVNVTFTSQNLCNFGSDHDLVVAIPATTGERLIGRFPLERFGALVSVSFSSATGITCDVLRLSQ
jgi:hypothetical protein